MKKFFIFLGIVVVIVLTLHIVLFVFINTKGKDVIAESIKKNLGVEASIESLTLKFPFNIEIKNFKCADISFKKANLFLGMPDPFRFRIILNKVSIDGLNMKITKNKEGVVFLPLPAKSRPAGQKEIRKEVPVSQAARAEKKELAIKLHKGYINNGVVEFIDLTGKKPVNIIFENVILKLNNFSYPKLTKFYITLESALKTDKGISEEAVSIDGWLDYFHKNMDADLNLNAIDYTSFSEYYPSFWKPDNLGIKEAYLSLQANLKSKDNNLIIDSILSLDKIEFIEDEGEYSDNRDLIRTMIAFIQGDKEKATLNLRFKTKMDSPHLDFSSIKDSLPGSAFIITQGVISKTGKAVSESIKDVKEITLDKPIDTIKETIDTLKNIFDSSDDTNE